jgi:plasmid stabilization system protein ParE
MAVICGIHKQPHPSAADVRDCYAARAASEAKTYGRALRGAERVPAATPEAASVDRFDRYGSLLTEHAQATSSHLAQVAKRQASTLATFQEAVRRTPVKTAGVFKREGIVFKVKVAVHGSGKLYAQRWNPGTQSWSYELGAMRFLAEEDRMTLAEASEWGKLYGTCIACGTTLTDEKSIAAGIGRVCATKVVFA